MRFGLLGPLTVQDTAGTLLPVGAPKPRALLAALLLRAGRPVSRDRLQADLWGESPPVSADAALHNYIGQLRRGLGPEGAARLCTVPSGYVLDVGGAELDAAVFTERLDAARSAHLHRDWQRVASQTAEALTLWRGAPFGEFPSLEIPAQPLVRQLEEGRLQALEWQMDAKLELKLPQAAVPELTRLTAEYPLSEVFHRQLMLALHQGDRQAEALDVYNRLRRRLVDELGVDPAGDLQQLYQRILRAEPVLTPAMEHAGSAGLTQQTGLSTPPTPAQLPGDLPDFTGREALIEKLCDLLSQSPPVVGVVPVVAICGSGGMGKTTLAVHVAHRLAAEFPDGQLYVNLRGVDADPPDSGEVLASFLRDLGLPDTAIPPGEAARAARFRSLLAGRRVLVLLDNARDASQVRPLIPGSAGCAVLVSSSLDLSGLAGATQFGMEILDDAEAHQLFAAVAGRDRVAADPEASAQVLAHCAGLPLAVRIAAARLASRRSWSVATLAGRLDDRALRLDELCIDDIAVRTSFRMSYTSLPTPHTADSVAPALAFRLLSLVPGSDVGLLATAALFGTSAQQSERALEHLVDASLLDSPAPGRYRLHDLLRIYAGELAEAEESEATRHAAVERLVRWYTNTVIEADALLFPGRPRFAAPVIDPSHMSITFADRDAASEWFAMETPNLVRALRLAAAHGLHESVLRMSTCGWQFLAITTRSEQMLTMTELGLSAARALDHRAAVGYLLTTRSTALGQLGRWDETIPDLMESLAIQEDIGDDFGQLASVTGLGLSYFFQGRYHEAKPYFERALVFAGTAESPMSTGIAWFNLGNCELDLGNVQSAEACYRRSLEILRDFDEPTALLPPLIGLGRVCLERHQFADAVPLLREAVKIAQGSGDLVKHATSLAYLAQALCSLGKESSALEPMLKARALLADLPGAEPDRVRAVLDPLPAWNLGSC
jgi:DNA-binding SARP family transcriptional activator